MSRSDFAVLLFFQVAAQLGYYLFGFLGAFVGLAAAFVLSFIGLLAMQWWKHHNVQ